MNMEPKKGSNRYTCLLSFNIVTFHSHLEYRTHYPMFLSVCASMVHTRGRPPIHMEKKHGRAWHKARGDASHPAGFRGSQSSRTCIFVAPA